MTKVQIQTITPTIAAIMLERNVSNRKIAKSRITQYCRDMLAGEWEMNCEPIKFDSSGDLIDGQHRLTALVRAGVSMDFVVARGICDAARRTIDTGKVRSGGDALSIDAGVSQIVANRISGAINLQASLRAGRGSSGGNDRMTNAQVIQFYFDNKDDIDSCLDASSEYPTRGAILLGHEALAFLLLFYQISPRDAVRFMNAIVVGDGLERGTTLHSLRELLVRDKMSSGVKMPQRQRRLTLLKCWNSMRRGRNISAPNRCRWYESQDSAPIRPI